MSDPRNSRKNRATGDSPAELDLVPIMNLVVCLIPIVLLGTSLIRVGTIEAEPPRLCASCTGAADEAPLGLAITVGAEGFELRAHDRVAFNTALIDLLDPAIAEPDHLDIPRRGEALDFVALYNALVQIKTERPDAFSVAVGAAEGVPWKEVVATLDVARSRLVDDHYDDAAALARATPRAGPDGAGLLFPGATLMVSRR